MISRPSSSYLRKATFLLFFFLLVTTIFFVFAFYLPSKELSKDRRTAIQIAPSPSPQHLTTLSIPVYIQFLATDIDKTTGQPLIRSHGKTEGLSELTQAIEVFNSKAAEAAHSDPRRIELVQVGMRIATSTEPCPDPTSVIEPFRVFGAINILFQTADNCVPMSNPSQYARSDAEAFSHEMGHALGLKHTFFANNVPGQAEILARIKNPTDPQSCYVLGDNVCDTPPDYGYRFVTPDGKADDSRIVCSV